LGVAFAIVSFLLSFPLFGATATALVTVRVLGHADDNVAVGAVTVSRISSSSSDVAVLGVAPSSKRDGASSLPALSSFRIGGGRNATFAVALPSAVTVSGESGELSVTGFHADAQAAQATRLSAEGTAIVKIGASVSIPAGQAAGRYEGSYPVTIAYN
jgi:hypothetical protein